MKRRCIPLLILAAIASMGVGEGIGEWRPPDAGGGSGFPGVSGSTGNDDTLNALYAMTNIPIYPSGPVYHFSCDAGGDYPLGTVAGPGTKAAPFLNWAEADKVTVGNMERVTLRFDAYDTCFVFAAASDLSYQVNELPGSKVPVLRIDSSEVGNRALLTQTGAPSIGITHLFGAVDAINTTGGRFIIQDMEFASFTDTVLVADDGIDMLALNVKHTAADGTRESLSRPVMDSHFVCINCELTGFNNSVINTTENASETYIGRSRITMSTPAAATTSVVANNGNTATQTTSLTIVGHEIYMPASSSGSRQVFQSTPIANTTSRTTLVRTLVHGADFGTGACIRWVEGDDRLAQIELYQVTATNCDTVLTSTTASAYVAPVNASTFRRVVWSLFDGGPGISFFLNITYGGSIEAGLWDAHDNVINLRGGAVPTFIRYRRPVPANEDSVSVAAFRADLATDTVDSPTAMAGAFADGTIENSTEQFNTTEHRCSTGDAFDTPACVAATTDSTSGSPDGLCDESASPDSCKRSLETAVCYSIGDCYTVTGSPSYTARLWAPVWAEALGINQDLEYLNLTVDKYGAR